MFDSCEQHARETNDGKIHTTDSGEEHHYVVVVIVVFCRVDKKPYPAGYLLGYYPTNNFSVSKFSKTFIPVPRISVSSVCH